MIEHLVRKNILTLKPFSTAYDDLENEVNILLDANENPFGSPILNNKFFNRYPDPLQMEVKEKISMIKGVPPQNIFLGNGSDEAIDVLLRIFCEPNEDACIICPPAYSRYETLAHINNVMVTNIPLLADFNLDVEQIIKKPDGAKILFLCSPNNPTGNSVRIEDVEKILENFKGIVVMDEAYINYSRQPSFTAYLPDFQNIVVLQTFSKAWGLAGLRVGMAFASTSIINLMNNVKLPYNLNAASQKYIIDSLEKVSWVNEHIIETARLRAEFCNALKEISIVEHVYPSDANFVLARIKDAENVYKALLKKGIMVGNKTNESYCKNCLCITIGTEKENNFLLEVLNQF